MNDRYLDSQNCMDLCQQLDEATNMVSDFKNISAEEASDLLSSVAALVEATSYQLVEAFKKELGKKADPL